MAAVATMPPGAPPFVVSAAMVDQIMSPPKPGLAQGDAEVKAGRFILNGQGFIDLQLYLKAASMMPESNARFDAEFPSDLFGKWFQKDPDNLLDVRCFLSKPIFYAC